ncbi:hypothetical protein Hanom_Chr03g00199951 [Helianthus anomalus]
MNRAKVGSSSSSKLNKAARLSSSLKLTEPKDEPTSRAWLGYKMSRLGKGRFKSSLFS